VPESRVPDVINYHKGKCFLASSPLLGATGKSGEWISLLAQELVSNGTYKSVIVMSLGIGGSPIAAWTEGSPLNKNLILNLKKISATYKITDIIFHQGESDARWLISSNIYYKLYITSKFDTQNWCYRTYVFVYCKLLLRYSI